MKKRSTLRNVAFALALGSGAAMVAGHVAMQTESVIGAASPQADEVKYSTVRVEAEDADALYDTYHYDSAISAGDMGNGETGRGLNSCWDTNFAVYENVDFIDGAVEVTVRKNVPRASAIEMWIDPVVNDSEKSFSGGTKIVDMEFRTSSMSWTTWENFTADVEGLPQGVHRLVVMFKTAAGTNHNQNLAAVNWFEFKVINNRVDLEALEAVEKNVSVNIFSKKRLAVEYVPENAMQRDVAWSVVSSEPEGVVEVSADGEVSGLNFGEAVVRATSVWNSAIYTDFNVSVVRPENEKIVIEAEEPVETYECKNVSDMSAEGSEASGGKGLGSDKAYMDSYMKYEFYAPEAGTYDLSVWYVTMNTRWISLQINDQMKTFMACDILTGNWNGVPSETAPGVASKSVKVYCEEGKNTLTVGAVYGYSPEEGRDQPYTPNIDRYELVRSDVEIEKPRDWTAADRIEREIESYDSKSGNASISKRVAFGTQQGGILAANGVFAYEVEAPEEGVYCMNIGYATANRRWIKVMVNELDTHYVGFFDYNGWGENANEKVYHHHLLVYLNKGKNLIELGQYKKEGAYASESDNSPALDRFTLDLVSYPEYEAPERKVNFYGHTLAEAAKWSSTFADILFFDHNEYTSSVSESTSATVTAEFPWPVVITGYAFATRNNADGWKVLISSNGESWKELTAVSTEKSGIIRTVRTENPYSDAAGNAARFVRLEISGSEPASLGEFCLWGNPYVSAECHMPAGVLEPGFADFETTHEGFDTGGWHEGIDKMFNGICTDRFTVAADGTGSMGDYDDITIDLNLGKAVAVNSYLMAVHYTTSYDRNPTQWELYRGAAVTEASQYDEGYDGWNLIDSRSDMNFVMPGSALPMYVDNETESDRYRLVIKNRRGKATHLAGFQMFTAPDYTGIEGVEANAGILMVSGGDGVIRILASAGEAYAVYTSSGLMVATGEGSADAVEIAVPRGIYVVAAGAKAVKVLVK